MPRPVRYALVAVPVILVAAAVAVGVTHPSLRVNFRVDVWLLVAEAAAAVAIALALVAWTARAGRRDAQRGADRARQDAERAAVEGHRRFVSRLDHELKNPLTAIRAGISNVVSACDGDVRMSALTTALDVQVMRLVRVTADLRRLAAIESAPLDIATIAVEELLAEVVDDAVGIGLEQTPAVDVVLQLPHRPWPLPQLHGDRDLLHLAVLNLVSNAVKFSPAGGVVTVSAMETSLESRSGPLMIEVADQGIGIAAEESEQIWDELARGRAARGLPGSGIGLAMVRAIVQRHGGDVVMRSIEGRGTVMTVRLPSGGGHVTESVRDVPQPAQ